METKHADNSPRVGTGNAGESHTPASAGDRAVYTGGPKHALKEGRRNDDFGNELTDTDLLNDLAATTTTAHVNPRPVHITAPETVLTATPGGEPAPKTDDHRPPIRTPIAQLERLAELEDGTRAAIPMPVKSKFFGTGEGTSDNQESGNETAVSQSREEEIERSKRRFRKRRGSEVEESDSDRDKNSVTPKNTKRGRGRPPTTGDYVGMAKAKKDYLALRREAEKAEAEQEFIEETRRLREMRSQCLSVSSYTSDVTMGEDDVVTRAKLGSQITESLDTITKVAKTSNNLSGRYVKALKDAVLVIRESCAVLFSHSTSDETRALETANKRLSREVTELKEELAIVKRELLNLRPQAASSAPPSNIEEIMARAVREAVSLSSARLDARLEALETRLLPAPRLRPPLAADKRNEAAGSVPTSAEPPQQRTEPEPAVSTLMPPLDPGPAQKKKRKTKKSAAAVEAAASRREATPTPAVPGPTSSQTWTEVVKRKGKVQKKVEEQKRTAPKKRKKKNNGKLRAPKTAAVVITLQEGAAERGVSYKTVMDKAKQKINLTAMEIPSVKFKQAVTGARMYEISGTGFNEKADALAQKLREVMDAEEVRISRPQKCAELRILGLDDTATAAEIAEAIAKPGGCSANDVKVGEIRRGRNGRGSAWVKCPVNAAKKVSASNNKIYVGWTVVRVVLLSARPMRCYKCHETGHTRATCPKEVDRSQLCFRCGQPDHSAAQCENQPHCALCEANGKPADHSVGSSKCGKPAPKKTKSSKKSHESQESATPTTAGSGTGAAPMEAQ